MNVEVAEKGICQIVMRSKDVERCSNRSSYVAKPFCLRDEIGESCFVSIVSARFY